MRDPLIDIRDDATGETIASRVHLSAAMADEPMGGRELTRLRAGGVVLVGGGAAPLYRLTLSGRLQ